MRKQRHRVWVICQVAAKWLVLDFGSGSSGSTTVHCIVSLISWPEDRRILRIWLWPSFPSLENTKWYLHLANHRLVGLSNTVLGRMYGARSQSRTLGSPGRGWLPIRPVLNHTFTTFKERPVRDVLTMIWGAGGGSARERGVSARGAFPLSRSSQSKLHLQYTWLAPRRKGRREGREEGRESREMTSLL